MSDAVSIAGSPTGGAVFSIVLFALFVTYGLIIVLNYADITYRLFGYFSRVVFVGPATPGTLRVVGAGIAMIGTVGLVVELIELFR
ncbi:hypothetical protein KBZ10_08390 [Streptomyces sp. F63]|uniref:hypothetical protein n=1 Tax=Streptomyces sp. F63 TaxID=2824887 RepID=UPI001B377EF7|nr:hypothetical protein [Streptomyces sp. F63]MBQ0984536.1 hypothetical protein [Streptomyces sp. F63]